MEPVRPRHRAALLLSSLCLVWSCLFEASTAGANVPLSETGAPFGVRSAYLQLVEGVYLLTARLHLPVDDNLRSVLKDGVALQLGLEFRVIRRRSYWLDEDVAALVQQYQLRYHAVSDRYLVRNLNGGEQLSFPTLEAALEQLTYIEKLPVLDQALVSKDRSYEARLRAIVDVGELPSALRWLMFWTDGGHRVSEWYSWQVLH